MRLATSDFGTPSPEHCPIYEVTTFPFLIRNWSRCLPLSYQRASNGEPGTLTVSFLPLPNPCVHPTVCRRYHEARTGLYGHPPVLLPPLRNEFIHWGPTEIYAHLFMKWGKGRSRLLIRAACET